MTEYADYFASRRTFCALAQSAGYQLAAWPIAAPGPNGEVLTIDVAVGGSGPAALIVSSGLHGVEGPCGAAAQCAWLAQSPRLFTGVRVILLHALNPYGFAWNRRVNEDNIDLNRNFLLPHHTYSGSHWLYQRLNSTLNPSMARLSYGHVLLRLVGAQLRFSKRSLQQAIAEGQYDFPQGIFYGGACPSATHHLLATRLPAILQHVTHAVHIDIHSGLGRPDGHLLIMEPPTSQTLVQQVSRWFTHSPVYAPDREVKHYHIRGGFGRWCRERLSVPNYLYLCTEFGTYAAWQVLAGLIQENHRFHACANTPIRRPEQEQKFAALFTPTGRRWRTTTLQKLQQIFHQGVAAALHLQADAAN